MNLEYGVEALKERHGCLKIDLGTLKAELLRELSLRECRVGVSV
jgi:hypothetical protein